MAIIPTYGATYIVSATDHSLDAIRARLMPMAQAAGFESVSLMADCASNGTHYSAYGHTKTRAVSLVYGSPVDKPATLAEFEDLATSALYTTIGRAFAASL